MKLIISSLFIIVCSIYVSGQDTIFVSGVGGGIELQGYPTGFISTLVLYKEFNNKNFVHARIGYNLIRHGDAGVHQDERGDGWGGSLGFDRSLKVRNTNVLLGARCDIWYNILDWKNNIGQPTQFTGTTKVTVVQPTVRLSYPIKIGVNYIVPALAFGSEVNVKTRGDEVGQGIILLLGVSYIIR